MKKSERTKKRILDAALAMFLLRGYNGTSMRDVLNASGVKAGNFYFYFNSKEELGLAVLDDLEGMMFDILESAYARDDLSPIQKLGAMMGALVAYIEIQECRGGCLFGNMAMEMSDQNQRYRERVEQIFKRWQRSIEILIREAQQVDEISGEIDPLKFSEYILMALEGGIMFSKMKKEVSPLKNAISQIQDHLLGK